MKSKENEKKTFDVTITFKRETDYYVVESVDLVLPTLEGTDETKEKIILKALSNLSVFEGYDFPELEVSYNNRSFSLNLDEATISKLAKKSKSLKEFSWFVHKELVKINIDSLRDYYEGRDGEPGITIKEVLECGAWRGAYGCTFDIDESTEDQRDESTEDQRFVSLFDERRREELFFDLCNKKKETELGKEVKAIKGRMLNVLLRVRKNDDPIELDKLSTEYIELSKELVLSKKADDLFDLAYRSSYYDLFYVLKDHLKYIFD